MISDQVIRFHTADVKCHLCGRFAGTLRRRDDGRHLPPQLQGRDGSSRALLKGLTELHCGHCGGPLYAEGSEIAYEYIINKDAIPRPRRGRPRKQPLETLPNDDAVRDAGVTARIS